MFGHQPSRIGRVSYLSVSAACWSINWCASRLHLWAPYSSLLSQSHGPSGRVSFVFIYLKIACLACMLFIAVAWITRSHLGTSTHLFCHLLSSSSTGAFLGVNLLFKDNRTASCSPCGFVFCFLKMFLFFRCFALFFLCLRGIKRCDLFVVCDRCS